MTQTTNQKANNSIIFTVSNGILGVDQLPANAAVLTKNINKKINGVTQTFSEFIAITGIKRTTPEAIVLPLLALFVADAQTRNGLKTSFEFVSVNGATIPTKLNFKSNYTKWLATNAIFRTDSNGELRSSLICDEGVKLNHTNLSIKRNSPLLTEQGEALSALLKQTAKAIVAQANLKQNIIDTASAIYTQATTTEKAATTTEKAA